MKLRDWLPSWESLAAGAALAVLFPLACIGALDLLLDFHQPAPLRRCSIEAAYATIPPTGGTIYFSDAGFPVYADGGEWDCRAEVRADVCAQWDLVHLNEARACEAAKDSAK